MSTLADRLQQAMARRPGLSVAQLAREVGVKPPSIFQWLSGQTKSMRSDVSRRTAVALGCRREWLETGLGDPGWTDAQPPFEVREVPLAQYVSQRPSQTAQAPVHNVPVIGTLGQGAQEMFVLDSPGGKAIGAVPAYAPSPRAYALRVFGDALYPAVRHGACLVADPDARIVEGELALLEMTDGTYLVAEVVALRDDAVILTPAVGGPRKTIPRVDVAAVHAITDVVSSSRFEPYSPPG